LIRDELARSPLASQGALAVRASVSDTVVSDLITASRPVPLDTVLVIARAISADAAWLDAVQRRWLAAKAEWAGQSRQLPADSPAQPATAATVPQDRRRGQVWMVPAAGRALVGRGEVTEQLAALALAGHPVVGVVGAGGFGKTTLVGQVCHRVRDAFPGGVLWVTLGEQLADAVLADKINDLSELVSGTRPALTDPAAAGHRLGELLAGRGPALLVVDDVWAASRLAPFLQAGARVVATTRSRGVLPGTARVLSLGSLSPEESRSLLGLGVPGLTRTDRLIQVTGRWAILLALVNGAIRRLVEEGVAAPDAAADLVAEQLRLDGPDSLDLDSADRRDQAVRATIEASIRRLDLPDRDRFLELGVFPEDAGIPVEVVHLLWSAAGLPSSKCRHLVRILTDLSLVRVQDEALHLHDILRAYLRRALGPGGLARASGTLAAELRAEAPDDWVTARPYTLRYLAGHAAEAGMLDPLLADPGFLLAADQPGLVAFLPQAKASEARAAAQAYQRAAHHLRDKPAEQRPAYLELAMRQVGADAESAARHAARSPWRCTWARWHAEPPHHILTRHRYQVRDVGLATLATGQTLAFSLDIFWHLRIIDAISNEKVDLPWPLPEYISAIACMPLPEGGYALIAGTEPGSVRAWDIDSGKQLPWELPLSSGDLWELIDRGDGVAPADPADADDEVPLPQEPQEPEDAELGSAEHTERVLALAPHDPGPDWDEYVDHYHDDVLPRIRRILWAAAPAGPVVLIVRFDQSVQAVDATTGHTIREQARPGDAFRLSRWRSPEDDGPRVTVRQAGWKRSWDLRTCEMVEDADGFPARSPVAAWLPDGSEVSGYGDGSIWVTATPTDRVGRLIRAHSGPVSALAGARLPDGRVLVASSGLYDFTVRLWNLRGPLESPGRAESAAIERIAVAGRFLVTGHADPVLRVWQDGNVIREMELNGPPTVLIPASSRPGDTLVVCATEQGPPQLLDVAAGCEAAAALGAVTGRVIACAATRRGLVLLTGDKDTVRAWDAADGRQLWRAPAVKATAVTTPDGNFLVGDYAHGTITARSARTGRPGWSTSWSRGKANFIGVLPGTDVTSDHPVVAFILGSVHAYDLASGAHLAAGTHGDSPPSWGSPDRPDDDGLAGYDDSFRRNPDGSAVIANDTVLVRLADGSAVAAIGGPVLRLLRLVRSRPRDDPWGSRWDSPCQWTRLCDIDLDTPVTALAAGQDGSLAAGTARGIVRLHLQAADPTSAVSAG
jgi:WD40 repeat protein/DNA-binding transcriptional regulator YdaS (Cro superfamily)